MLPLERPRSPSKLKRDNLVSHQFGGGGYVRFNFGNRGLNSVSAGVPGFWRTYVKRTTVSAVGTRLRYTTYEKGHGDSAPGDWITVAALVGWIIAAVASG
jgi:hypothetical protein